MRAKGKFKGEKQSGTGNRTVVAAKTSSFNSREFLGIFWPEKIWKRENPGKKIAKRDVQWITHNGKRFTNTNQILSFQHGSNFEFPNFECANCEFNRYLAFVFPILNLRLQRFKGIVHDKGKGRPIGSIKLTSEHQISSRLESAVAASDSSHDDDVDAAFDHMQKKLRVSSAPLAKSDCGGHALRAPVIPISSHLPGDTYDLLDSIWGGAPVSSGTAKKLKKRNTEDSSESGKKTKNLKAKAKPAPS